jgi:shikimate dehydrogenase
MKGFGAGAGTLRFAVLGFPARHSLSPRMHQAAFRALGLPASYGAIEVPPVRLAAELERLHAEVFAGLNLTTPLKERAITLVRRTTPDAAAAGAVNTLRREPDGWIGHATDGLGFDDWARELGIEIRGARVLLVGAGGAARSIVPSLVRNGPVSVDIVSRTGSRARELAARVHALTRGAVRVGAAALNEPPEGGPWTLLVRLLSTTQVGEDEAGWWNGLAEDAAVLEGNYEERAAGARAWAASRGLRFEDGLGLLLHQGARSFAFWIGVEPPLEVMRKALNRPG